MADLAADVRASTPSNVAQILTPDKKQLWDTITVKLGNVRRELHGAIASQADEVVAVRQGLHRQLESQIEGYQSQLAQRQAAFRALNPELVLAKGYAILTGKLAVGEVIDLQTLTQRAQAQVQAVTDLQPKQDSKKTRKE